MTVRRLLRRNSINYAEVHSTPCARGGSVQRRITVTCLQLLAVPAIALVNTYAATAARDTNEPLFEVLIDCEKLGALVGLDVVPRSRVLLCPDDYKTLAPGRWVL